MQPEQEIEALREREQELLREIDRQNSINMLYRIFGGGGNEQAADG